MLRRTESYAGKAQRNIAAPYQHKKLLQSSQNESNLLKGQKENLPSDFVDHSNFSFKKLDEINEITFKEYCGPTPESNWVIPGVLLVGAYPASQDDEETYELITSILKEHVTKFVCLQQEYRDEGVTVEMWRSGDALRPYFHDVRMVVHNKAMFPDLQGFNIVDREALSFVHFPIRDCGITDDERVLELSRTLVKAISEGQVIYLHCWGGHGRTGTLVCIMLHLMYSLDSVEAMSRCQLVHDLRKCPVVVGSPQTQTQRDQVTRVIRRLMTQTRFHRRTLSDLFSHTGSARLSILMDQEGQQSPRSDFAPSYPFAQGVDSRLMACSAPDMDSDDNLQEEDEGGEEMVVAMGYDSVEEDCNLNFFDVSKVSETSSFSISSLAAAQPIEGDAGSYIDSDEHEQVTAGLVHRSSAVAVQSCSSAVQQHLCLSPSPGLLSPARLLTVFSPPSLADHHRRLNFSNLAEAIQQGVDASTLKASDTNTNSPQSLTLTRNVPVSVPVSASGIYPSSTGLDLRGVGECEGEACASTVGIAMEMNMEVTDLEENPCPATAGAGTGQAVSCSNDNNSNINIDFCEYGLMDSTEAEGTSETKDTASVDAIEGQSESSVTVKPSVSVSVSTAASPLVVISRSANYIGTSHTSEKEIAESDETKGGDSTPSKGSDRLSYPVPVPVPPSASSRPSSAAAASSSSSSSSGVLAGLRNFRMQWGVAQGSSTSATATSNSAHTPTPPPCIIAGGNVASASPILQSGRKTVSVAANGFSVPISPSTVTDKDKDR